MQKNRILAMLIVALFISGGLYSQNRWKLSSNRNGIKSFTRPVKGSKMKQFKGETVINANLKTIVAVLRDVPSQPKWMGDCLKSKLLKTFNKNHIVAYNVLNLPWPVKDRDLQIDTQFIENYDNGRVVVKMTVYPTPIEPITKKYVRVTDFEASCTLIRIDENKTKVIYINRIDPKTNVPEWMANMVAKTNPRKTLTGMIRMVKLSKYKR